MSVSLLLRAGAFAAALVGLFDPTWTVRRSVPVPVEVVSDADMSAAAADVRERLARSLDGTASLASDAAPTALVAVGRPAGLLSAYPDGLPISTVMLEPARAPNLQVIAAGDPSPVRVGWAATFAAVVEARGMAGKTSRIVLEDSGARVASLEHRWTRDVERLPATLRYAPPAPGTTAIRLRVLPAEGEVSTTDNVADLRLVTIGAPFEVLVHQPRPSWNATFVRRALEQDPGFNASSVTLASKGLAVRAGTPPSALTAEALHPFDAVIVGAPEELRPAEIDALKLFARRRGGAIFLLPDRRPSGPYLELVPANFDEILIEDAVELRAPASLTLRATELAVIRAGTADSPDAGTASEVHAWLARKGGDRAVVWEWLEGSGRIVFSGALDAWRFRAASDDGFARFWRSRVAEAARSAPPRIATSFSPGVPRPGETVTIRVRIRPTEFEEGGGVIRVPSVGARLVGGGADDVVRLWPAAERGMFEGRFQAPAAGAYDLQVSTGSGASRDDVIVIADDAQRAVNPASLQSDLALIAASTGGVAVTSADLAPLEQFLRGLSRGEVDHRIRPGRSVLLLLVFAGLLSAEWTFRRRRGKA
jgi:hypothetical protein